MLQLLISEPEDPARCLATLRHIAHSMERELPEGLAPLDGVRWVAEQFCDAAGMEVMTGAVHPDHADLLRLGIRTAQRGVPDSWLGSFRAGA